MAETKQVEPLQSLTPRIFDLDVKKAWDEATSIPTDFGKKKQSLEHQKVSHLIYRYIYFIDNNLDTLEKAIQELLNREDQMPYRPALLTVLDAIKSEKPSSPEEIENYVNQMIHEGKILYEKDGDLNNDAIRQIRKQILINKLIMDRINIHKINPAKIVALAARGVLKNQWIGRGLSEEIALALYEINPKIITPYSHGSNIAWNHCFIDYGDTFEDPTWKQFFTLIDTENKPPVFFGTAEDFRKLGLPEDRTEDYLQYIGKRETS